MSNHAKRACHHRDSLKILADTSCRVTAPTHTNAGHYLKRVSLMSAVAATYGVPASL